MLKNHAYLTLLLVLSGCHVAEDDKKPIANQSQWVPASPGTQIDAFSKVVAAAQRRAIREKLMSSAAVWSRTLNAAENFQAARIVGGPEDNIYIVNNRDDRIQEEPDQGTDTVIASVDFTLPENVENLILTGKASSGTGNTLSNILTANDQGNWLNGAEGADTLIGGKGNDLLWGGLGADAMRGGAGDDIYFVDDPGDQVLETNDAGFDIVIASVDHSLSDNVENLSWLDDGSVHGVTFSGNALNNTIVGSPYDDVLFGGDGDDTLSGSEGDDLVYGNAGDDRIDDTLGNNKLYGGDGNDSITGSGLLAGGQGDDLLMGANPYSNDTYVFNLGDGSDQIEDAGGDDVLTFGSGVDEAAVTTEKIDQDLIFWVNALDQVRVKDWFLDESHTIETIRFDDGTEWKAQDALEALKNHVPSAHAAIADVITVADEPIEKNFRAVFSDEDVDDQLTFSATLADGQPLPAWLSVNSHLQQLEGTPTGSDVGTLSLRLTATDRAGAIAVSTFQVTVLAAASIFNDQIIGTSAADVMFGGAGQDLLIGLAGDDILNGGAGDDNLVGDAGNDRLNGGTGNDTLNGGPGNNVYLFGQGDGQDVLVSNPDSTPGKLNTLEMKAGVEPDDLVLRLVYDPTQGEYSALEISIAGTPDKVTVSGVLSSGNFYNPNNPLQQIRFADGTVWNLEAIKAKIYGGTLGADIITGTAMDDIIRGQAGDDKLYGRAGNDTLYGGSGANEIYGGIGDDTLVGGDENDMLHGDEGDDTLVGGDGNDLLYGEDGDDILDGGPGKDGLVGGKGNNTYLFGRGYGYDPIWGGGADSTPGKLNTLQFKAGILPSDLILRRFIDDDGHDSLEAAIAGTSDRVVVRMFFKNGDPYNPENGIQQIKFTEDGTIWNIPDIVKIAGAYKEVYSLKVHISCWGPGTDIDMIGSAMEIASAVVAAANSPAADCHNAPPAPNNVYTFGRQDGATLYFNCESVTDCGGRSIDSFWLTLTKVEAAAGGKK